MEGLSEFHQGAPSPICAPKVPVSGSLVHEVLLLHPGAVDREVKGFDVEVEDLEGLRMWLTCS